MKKLVAALALILAGSSHAAVLTSTAAPQLAGATIHTFDDVTPGAYAVLNLPGVQIIGNGGPMSVDSNNSSFGIGGRQLNNYSGSPSSFDLVFTAPVGAFGIYSGAVNAPWVYTAYDVDGNELESFTTPGTCCGVEFYGLANAAGIARVNLRTSYDWAVFDNLYVAALAPADLPEPASIALFGAAIAAYAGTRRAKRARK